MDRVRYRVDDLHCESCCAELGEKLRAVANVTEAVVDAEAKEVVVVGVDFSPDAVRSTIAGAGYTPEQVA